MSETEQAHDAGTHKMTKNTHCKEARNETENGLTVDRNKQHQLNKALGNHNTNPPVSTAGTGRTTELHHSGRFHFSERTAVARSDRVQRESDEMHD